MRRSLTRGLTQLELLIGLAIMGLMAVLLANVLNFSRLSLERSYLLTSATERLLAQDVLRSRAEDMPLEFGAASDEAPFFGDEHSLRFKTLVTDGTFWAGVFVQVELSLVPGSAGEDLVITSHGLQPDAATKREVSSVLAEGVSNLRISYYGRRKVDTAARWLDEWKDSVFLPELVKVEWDKRNGSPVPPLTLLPAKTARHKYMSLSSLVPPG